MYLTDIMLYRNSGKQLPNYKSVGQKYRNYYKRYCYRIVFPKGVDVGTQLAQNECLILKGRTTPKKKKYLDLSM